MNLRHGVHVLMMCSVLILIESVDAYDQAYGPISFYAWDQPHCKGNCTVVNFDDAPLYYISQNVSNPFVAHSFRLTGRGLTGKEQLDLSVALNDSNKGPGIYPLALENAHCMHFLQSYTGFNGSMDCHDVPPFTCQRLWINRGLPAVFQLSSAKATMTPDFTCQTISVPAHSALPKGSSSAKVTARSSSSVPALPSTTSKTTLSPTNPSTVTTAPLQTVIQSVLVVLSPETTYTRTYYSTL